MRSLWPALLAIWSATGILIGSWLGARHAWRSLLAGDDLLRSCVAFLRSETFPAALLLALGSAFVFFVVGHATTRRPDSPPLTWFDVVIAGAGVTCVASLAFLAAGR